MVLLRDFSVMWSLVHTLIIFIFLFESRYSKKKTMTITLSTMIPLMIFNFLIFVFTNPQKYISLMLITLSLPSLIFFWILSKHRDGRFVFTFCMIDTIVLEIIYVTNIIDHYIPGYWFMFFVRLFAYPLLEWFIYKKFRGIYKNIQSQVKKGWWVFAAIGLMFYVAMTIYMCYPTMITDRPEYLPVLIILFILMPISYINIFNALLHQQNVYSATEQENILKVQVSDMTTRIAEFSEANNKFRMERHNFRHKMQTISRLIENKEYDKLQNLVLEYNEAISETKVKRYCENAVLDAVFSSYLPKAEKKGIKVNARIAFPDKLTVSETELATVFANAIENAINACEKIEEEKRYIDIKVIREPQFMIQIENSFDGNAELDESGVPVTYEEGHGFGTRSIVAFCEKHEAYYRFKTEGDKFYLRIKL